MAVVSHSGAELRVERRAAAAALELRGLAHTYTGKTGSAQALASVDLTVGRGEFVAILGPSGCGKTTLLRAVAGLLTPSSGDVRLEGATPIEARRRRAIGWLAQDDGLLPWLSVHDNVALPYRVRGAAHGAAFDVTDILTRVGLDGSGRQYPYELSGGMRQRAALARALVARPAFLLLDEPFAHVDELTRERLGELLLSLRLSYAPTTLLVTHSITEAVRLADRVVMLTGRPGRVSRDLGIDLSQPRYEDQPGFGALVRELKAALT